MKIKPRLYLTGTMRTGGSLLVNLLSVHSKIIILASFVHFFRFIYRKYEPLNPKNVELLLHHLHLRLKHRYNININVEQIFESIEQNGFTYQSIYSSIMQFFLEMSDKQIIGEYAVLNWREIPIFLNLFPEGKAIHIIRDPRGVISSWEKFSSLPNNGYLNAIFNWIDSANYMEKYIETLPPDRYFPIRFEDIHNNPEFWIRSLCDFIGVKFEETMNQPEKWRQLTGDVLVRPPRSSHEGKDIVGFSKTRAVNWQKHLKNWEICITELLTIDKLEKHGYLPFKKNYSLSSMRKSIDMLRLNPLGLRELNVFLASGQGINEFPTDPTLPENWAAPHNPREWFTQSSASKSYFSDIEAIERLLSEKYNELAT